MSTLSIKAVIDPCKRKILEVLHQDATPSIEEIISTTDTKKLKYDFAMITNVIGKLEQYTATLEAKVQEWIKLIDSLTNQVKAKSEEAKYESALEEENNFNEVIERGKDRLVELKTKKQMCEDMMKECREGDTTSMLNRPSTIRTQLPTLQIQKFDGTLTEFPKFWSLFTNMVDDQPISQIEKMSHLISLLEGDAMNSISGYNITPENYELIKQKLIRDFGKKDELIKRLYEKLNQPSTNPKDFKQTVEMLECTIRQLEQLNEDLNAPYVEWCIEKSLPYWAKLELLSTKRMDPSWNITKTREKLRIMLDVRESLKSEHVFPKNYQRPFKLNDNKGFHQNKREQPFKVYNAQDSNPSQSTKKVTVTRQPTTGCAFCNGMHWSDACRKYDSYSKRFKRVKENSLCFKCLRKGHSAENCRQPSTCYYCRSKEHPSALCKKRRVASASEAEEDELETPLFCSTSKCGPRPNSISPTVFLSLTNAKVISKSSSKTIEIPVLLDVGSERSFITEGLARNLGFHLENERDIIIEGIGESVGKRYKSSVIKVKLLQTDGKHCEIVANTLPKLTRPINKVCLKGLGQQYLKYFNGEHLKSNKVEPQILIGADFYYDVMHNSHSERLKNGLYFVQTILGNMLCGKESNKKLDPRNKELIRINCHLNVEQDSISEFWELESIGIKDKLEVKVDEEILESFTKSIERKEGRYYCQWPWTDKRALLENNYGVCLGRLRSTMKRLSNKPELTNEYIKCFDEQLEQGVIEDVTEIKPIEPTYYMPHQLVIRPNKSTTKVRVVYDASSKSSQDKLSLNEVLAKGPTLLPNMLGILLRIRTYPILITADVEKAFLQIGLKANQRDCTRFLWLKDVKRGVEDDNIRIFRFTRVPFGIISSPFILNATIKYHLEHYDNDLAQEIKANTYVDNVFMRANDPQQAVTKGYEAKEIFQQAALNLREFRSNCKDVIFENDASDAKSTILGIEWMMETDELIIKLEQWPQGKPLTKRNILSFTAAIYDPIGFLTPITLPLKLFLKHLWNTNYGWDDQLTDEDSQKLKKLLEGFKNQEIRRPRLTISYIEEVHVFVDASKAAYGAIAYGRNKSEPTTHFIMSKSRVAPKRAITIPVMELLAVLIGTRLLNFIREHLKFDGRSVIWSDSQVVLQWISNGYSEGVFVNNRLREIRNCDTDFRYVPGQNNPADFTTRGVSADNIQQATTWWEAPDFLKDGKLQWPDWRPIIRNESNTTQVCAFAATNDNEIIDISRHSDYQKLTRTTVMVLRAAERFQQKAKNKNRIPKRYTIEPITVKELSTAENLLIKQEQRKALEQISLNQENLQLYVDTEGIFRSKGRIENAEMPNDTIQPIFLPKHSCLTKLIVIHIHERIAHAGVEHTLAELRRKYWITQGRTTVKRILRRFCMKCRRWTAKPFKLPNFPQLPTERVIPSRPFTHVGLDYFGPILVRSKEGPKKTWVALFTCLATRAIRLELIKNLTTEELLHVMRRFIARNGTPETVITDRATNFTLFKRILSTKLGSQTTWKLITPAAPWKGGFYERLIGVTKTAIRKVLGKTLVTENELATLISETESIVNSRPLVYIDDTQGQILRPVDFLRPMAESQPSNYQNLKNSEQSTNEAKELIRLWNATNRRIQQLWKIWTNNYLLSLRERYQTQHKQPKLKLNRGPMKHEIVLIEDKTTPRANWKLGKIIHLLPDNSNNPNAAKVRLSNGHELTKPISKLYPIEVTNDGIEQQCCPSGVLATTPSDTSREH